MRLKTSSAKLFEFSPLIKEIWRSTFLDENGLPSFNTLQNHLTAKTPVLYYVVDVLANKSKSLLGITLEQSRRVGSDHR